MSFSAIDLLNRWRRFGRADIWSSHRATFPLKSCCVTAHVASLWTAVTCAKARAARAGRGACTSRARWSAVARCQAAVTSVACPAELTVCRARRSAARPAAIATASSRAERPARRARRRVPGRAAGTGSVTPSATSPARLAPSPAARNSSAAPRTRRKVKATPAPASAARSAFASRATGRTSSPWWSMACWRKRRVWLWGRTRNWSSCRAADTSSTSPYWMSTSRGSARIFHQGALWFVPLTRATRWSWRRTAGDTTACWENVTTGKQ